MDDAGALSFALRTGRPNPKGWIRVNCPSCEQRTGKADRKRSLGFQVRSRYYHCFRCGVVGWANDVDTGYDAALFDDDEQVTALDPPDGFFALGDEPGLSAEACAPMRSYLVRRGVRRGLAQRTRIGACVTGRFRDRVVVPMFTDNGAWLWYVARSVLPNPTRKYLYPSGSRRGVIYNHPALFVETDEPVIVVEGAFDTFPFWPDACALLGDVTEEQVTALAAARRPLAIVLDGDAWEKGAALAMRLRMEGARAGAVQLPPRVDPDEVPPDELRAAARASLDA
jgi:DNA primase